MNNSAAKVGEIFREAGTAFTKLSEMTLMLQPMDDSPSGGKWSDEDVEMLRGCINRFAVELNKISQHIKNRTMCQDKRLLQMDISSSRQAPPFPHMPLQLPALHLQEVQTQEAQNVQPSPYSQQRRRSLYRQLQPQQFLVYYNHQRIFGIYISYIKQQKNLNLNKYLKHHRQLLSNRILRIQKRKQYQLAVIQQLTKLCNLCLKKK